MLGSLFKVSVAVAAAAVGVAVLQPELFFKIPKIGFIGWAISGRQMPPYFDYTMWEDDSWIKDGDVIVSVGAKCGTNWVMTMVHELRTWNKPELREFEDVTDAVPWAEFSHYPGESHKERIALWDKFGKWNLKEYPFRVFKSHMTPKPLNGEKHGFFQVLPIRERPKVKFIGMTRSGPDVLKSLEKFLKMHSEPFRQMWGGFPPPNKNYDENFNFMIPDEPIPVVDYVKEWWPYKDDDNVLFLHYSEASADLPGTLAKLAEFINIDIPKDEIVKVADRVNIDAMKPKNDRYLYRYGKNGEGLAMENVRGSIIRKGGVGTGKKQLSGEYKKRWDEHVKNKLSDNPELLKWYTSYEQ